MAVFSLVKGMAIFSSLLFFYYFLKNNKNISLWSTSESKMAAKRRFWKKTWPEFFQASPDVRLVVMVTYLKTMVSWYPWHDYRDKLENRRKHLFEIFKMGAP